MCDTIRYRETQEGFCRVESWGHEADELGNTAVSRKETAEVF